MTTKRQAVLGDAVFDLEELLRQQAADAAVACRRAAEWRSDGARTRDLRREGPENLQ
jgi:hypothetical protein